ncbi:DNA repair protein RecN [Rhizobacter sp. OV335]|uniref:DNA repair protein RecN n=1 Tax=Rhizobacter sp. OV335 TaxID=1500264 RepID=UPI00091AB0D5|nr:DNA repair protein RecN [Rhizobacter sp. OV335]SHM23471.1 DNA repair protein RecN (Recombination protein N) [Rhizobacter sp. OV335]
MLKRLALRDFVIVTSLEVELAGGFSVLTGETGAGKSILIDALQLALGSRGDAGVVREGAARADISAEFDAPDSLAAWLDDAGFDNADTLLLRRVIDAQGKSRAWVNGSPATVAQLREAADHLVDIHGQHAWQSLTRSPSVRALLDAYAGIDVAPLGAVWSRWKAAGDALDKARSQQADLERERERLAWQIGEVDKLGPEADEWETLNADHHRLSNSQALMDAARSALDALSEAEVNAESLTSSAADALGNVAEFDTRLADVAEVLQSAQAQLQDAAHTLSGYLHHTELEPERLQELDERLSAWVSLARRYRRAPAELPALLDQWKDELRALDAATDLDALESALASAHAAFSAEAKRVSAARKAAAPKLAAAVTQAMQQLGMAGGRFEVALTAQEAPQSFGLESAEFLVAGHAGSTPRPMGKVASGGELSRIALAIAVTTSQLSQGADAAGTLIFDEIDSGVGGAVADTVGRLMKQLGRDRQVLAVTHLPQVAACADLHYVVSKRTEAGSTHSDIHAVAGEVRVAEIARMLGGERMSGTSLAHAQEMLSVAADALAPAPRGRKKS